MKRVIRWTIVAVGVVGVGTLLAFAFRARPVEVDVAEIVRGAMRVTVEEDGQTRIRERYAVSAPLAGRLQRIALDPGDSVVAGQTLLVVIDPTDPALLDVRALAEADARVGQGEAAAQRAQAQLRRAEAAEAYERSELERISGLNRGTLGTAELQAAGFRAEAALQDVRSAEFGLQVAQFELEQARAALILTRPAAREMRPATAPSADVADRQFAVVSPVNGVVLRVLQESAVVVAAGTPLLEVGDPADLEAVVDVLSTDAVQIAPGAAVSIERWGGGAPLRGAVRLVEPAAFTKVSSLGVEEQRVNVIIDFVSPPDERRTLGDGYRVEAAIVLWEGQDVVRAPAGALFRRGEQWSVFAIEAGVAVERPVRIGRRNGLEAEVLEGLQPGDRVIAYPNDRVSAGKRVVAR